MEIKEREIEREYNDLIGRLGKVFYSESGFRMAQNYIKGLLGTAERKNGWQLSEYLGEATPYAIQQFIYRGRFSADEIRDITRDYVGEKLGEEDGVLVVDETGFLKQGTKSCGVKRQYSGTAGRVENCQIGVFLTYAGTKGHTPIDRRLYIPEEEWIWDKARCKEAGVPETVTFQTKPQMALEMIQEATASGIPYKWVTGDCVYGDYRAIRLWLEDQQKCYVMCVSSKEYIRDGFRQIKIGSILKNLPAEGWFEASCGDGSKGARVYDWLTLEINQYVCEGWKRLLMVRRSKTEPSELRAYICYGPTDTPDSKFVEVAGTRWTVETCFAESKSDAGLDQYEVRSYNGWYKHITFSCVALALITVLSSNSLDTKSIQQHEPASSSLEAFKKGRNLRV